MPLHRSSLHAHARIPSDQVRPRRQVLIGVMVAFVCATSLAYVIPHAQALDAAPAAPVPELQSYTVASASATLPVVRDSYGVTLPPPVQWPLPQTTRMSSDFGPRSCAGCSSNHQGIDLNAPGGTPIEAMAAGVVITASPTSSGPFGVHAEIQHLIDGEVVTTLYAHMRQGSMPLVVGEQVSVGQLVGQVGCTGNCSGDHLHFEIRPGGISAADPAAWLYAQLT